MAETNNPGTGASPDPLAPAENNSDLSRTTDGDDAVHQGKSPVSEENKEQDPDDAVHKTPTALPDNDINLNEQDPDDAVHSA